MFTDPDEYLAGIRNLQIGNLQIGNLQIVGDVLGRREFHSESAHIDLDRLFIYRSDVSLPWIMKVGRRRGLFSRSTPAS